ncbi:MAG: hypothetical protein A2X02_05550 [Bacteroidetes bacterium GWF2_29_10]|nr:MAG: hypothetical protein A2X02_05550 [Bacteroidetes bacterium GWF2_29_10]
MKKNQLYIIALLFVIITSQGKAQNTNAIIAFLYNAENPNSVNLYENALINDTNVRSVYWDDYKNETFYYKSNILGASMVLDPNTEYFSDLYFDADYRTHNNAYKVDSIYIRGNYKRPFNTYTTPNGDVTIVDTLIVELVYGDTSKNNSFAHLYTIGLPEKHYAAPQWIKDNYAANGMGKLYGDGYKVIKIPLTEADVTLDENNLYSPYLTKYYGIKTDFKVPSRKYVGLTYTFKSGIPKEYLSADPIYISSVYAEIKGNVYQNMNSFTATLWSHEDDEDIFYDSSSLSMNYALLNKHIEQSWSGNSSIFNYMLWLTENIGWDVWFDLSLSLSAGDDQTICKGTSATLTATGADSYVWSTGATTDKITVSPTVKTTYYVTGTSSGITEKDTVIVSIASINAGEDKTIIKGQQISLSASGDVSNYSWSTGDTTKYINVAPTTNTIYYVTGKYGECTDSDMIIITVRDVLWYEDFTSASNNFSTISGLTRNSGANYSCAMGNYISYTNSTKAYAMTKEFAVPQGKSIKLSFSSRRKNASAGQIKVFYNIGGGCSFNNTNNYENGWIEWGTITPNTSVASASGCTNQNLTLTNEICGGQIVSVLLYFPEASASNWITVDDIEIVEANAMVSVPDISGNATYTENFTQQYWYAPVTQTYPNAKSSGVKMPYHSLKSTSQTYAYLTTGGAGSTLDHSGNATDYKVVLAPGYEYCNNTGGAQIITKELNTSNCSATTATLRFDFLVKYPNPSSAAYSFVYNEDYSDGMHCPEVYYATGKPEGYLGNHSITWIKVPVNYYFPTGKWMRATCQLPKEANLKIKISRGSEYIEYIDNIKVLCDDCSISDKTGATPIGEANPAPSTDYTYTVAATAGATKYRWVIRKRYNSAGALCTGADAAREATLYWNAPAAGNPGIISGNGTQTAVINFGTCTDCKYTVMCIPYDTDYGTFAAPTDACYAKLGYTEVTLTTTASCTPPTLTAKANNTTTSLTICSGNTIALTSNPSGGEDCSGIWQYLWSNGANTQNVYDLTPTANTTYSVTVRCSADTTCSNTSQVTVNVNTNPIANFTFDTICSGFATQFTNTSIISEGDSLIFIYWDFDGIGFSNKLNPTFSFHGSGYYDVKVRVINNKGCIDSTIKTVIVYGSPVSSFRLDTVCLGTSTSFKEYSSQSAEPSVGILKWRWNFGDGTTGLQKDTFTHTYQSAENFAVSLQVEDSIGCIGVLNSLAVVRPLPTVNAGVDKTISLGDTTTLTAIGGKNYAWSNGAIIPTINVSPTVTTTYYVTVVDSNACMASDAVIVFVQSVGNVSAGSDQTICKGSSATLTATGADSYVWSTGATTNKITVSPNITTTYTVTGTSGGVTEKDTVIVSVNPLPTISAGTNKSICFGTSTLITATGGSSYVWNTSQTGPSITVTPNDTTTYTVVGTLNTCTASDEVIVIVKPLPVANAGIDTAICSGKIATLYAENVGADSYDWSNGVSGLATNVSLSVTTTYGLTVTKDGCTASDAVIVYVYSLPIIDAGVDKSICLGDSAILSVTGTIGGSYLWSTADITNSIKVGPVVNTTYKVTIDLGGCTNSDAVIVTVNPIPVANAGVDKTICMGVPATLGAIGSGSFTWSTGSNNNNISVNPTATTVYKLTNTVNGCSDQDSVVVTVNSLPNVYAGVDKSICLGDSVMLVASGASNYLWSNSATNDTIYVSPNVTSSYTITGTLDGCTATDGVLLSLYTMPVANFTYNTICSGFVTTFTNTSTVGIGTIIATSNWNFDGLGSSNLLNPTFTFHGSGYYDIILTTTDNNGCIDSITKTVIVYGSPVSSFRLDTVCLGTPTSFKEYSSQSAEPSVGILKWRWNFGDGTTGLQKDTFTHTYPTAGNYAVSLQVEDSLGCIGVLNNVAVVRSLPTANAGADKTICVGDSTQLNYIGTVLDSVKWSNGITTLSQWVKPTETTIYTVTVYSGGCSASDAIVVKVNLNPVINVSLDKSICIGTSTILTASSSLVGTTYDWSDGQTGTSITVTPNDTMKYTVLGRLNGCSGSDEVIVMVKPLPFSNAGLDTAICFGDIATLRAEDAGADSYAWSNGATGLIINVSPTVTTTYYLTITKNGCTASDAVIVAVYSLPTVNAGEDKTISLGDSVILTPTGSGGIYVWNIGDTINPIKVGPTQTETYHVWLYDYNGCTASDEVVVFVQSVATVSAGSDQTICKGFSATLAATGADTYVWNTGATTPTITVSPTTTTKYFVTGTNGAYLSVDSVIVIVNPLPTANAGEDKTITSGESVLLSATGGIESYTWSTAQYTQSIIVNPITTTSYQLTVNNGNCSASDEVVVLVNQKTLSIDKIYTSNASCYEANDGQAIVVAINGILPYSYSWSEGTTNDTVLGLSRGTYSVTVYDNEGASVSKTINIGSPLYVETPNTYTSNITNISATLNWNAIPNVTQYMLRYRIGNPLGAWHYINQSSTNTSVAVNYLVSNTQYEWQIRAIVSNQAYSCFTSLNSFTTATTSLCEKTTNLTVNNISSGSALLNWTLDNTAERYLLRYKIKDADNNTYKYFYIEGNQSSFPIYGLVPNTEYQYQIRKFCNGNYYSDFTDLKEFKTKGNCQIPDNLNTLNIKSSSAILQWIANQDIVNLMIRWKEQNSSTWKYFVKANNANSYLQIGCNICDDIHKLKPNTTYEWQIRAFCDANQTIYSDFTQIQTFTTEAIKLNLGGDRTICKGQAITLSTSQNGKYLWNTNDTTSYVTVSPTSTTTYYLTITINEVSETDEIVIFVNDVPTVNASNNQTICSGENAYLVASGADNYKWDAGSLQNEVIFAPLVTTTYSVTGTTNNGCSNTAQVIVTVNQTPYGNAGADVFLCNGDSSVIVATGGSSYSWDNNEVTPFISIKPTETTSYFVTISNGLCSITDMVVAVVTTINPSAGNDQTICKGQYAQLSAMGGIKYEWSNNFSTQAINVSPIITTQYIVTVFTANGCSASDNVTVFISSDLNVTSTNDTTICSGDKITLTAFAENPTSFRWSSGSIKQSITVVPAQTTTYTVTVKSGTCSGTDKVIVNIINCKNETEGNYELRIANYEFFINIYPNPSYDGKVNIETIGLESDAKLTVMSYTGAILLEKEINKNDNKHLLNLSNFSNGIMFIRIGTETFKIIKQSSPEGN